LNSSGVTSRADGIALLAKVVDIYQQQTTLSDDDQRAKELWQRWRETEHAIDAPRVVDNERIIATSLRTDYLARQAVTNALAIKW
jgi:hypothetical protein